jgi:hypothetical protein
MLVSGSRSMRFGFCSWVSVACLFSDAESYNFIRDYQNFALHQDVFFVKFRLMSNAVYMYMYIIASQSHVISIRIMYTIHTLQLQYLSTYCKDGTFDPAEPIRVVAMCALHLNPSSAHPFVLLPCASSTAPLLYAVPIRAPYNRSILSVRRLRNGSLVVQL